ncbi:MAG: hypothetical protein ACQEQ5_00230 [Thermodesulfobacteriota bacterium]
MKTIKFLILLIIIGLVGLLVYQNIDYFTTGTMLTLNLKFAGWTTPDLPNWAFWGICLGLGLLITGIKGLTTAFGLGRQIKKRDAQIAELTAQNADLQARLDVFVHDPYIKKGLSSPREDLPENTPENTPEDTREDTQEAPNETPVKE